MFHFESLLKTSALVLATLITTAAATYSQSSQARNGLPSIGGGSPPTCDTTIRNFSVSSGGTRAKDQIGLPPAGMIVFAEAMFRPCGVGDSITFQYFDGVSGQELFVPFATDVRSLGFDGKEAVHVTNLRLSYPYVVTVTTRNAAGELLQSQTIRIVTQNKI